MGVGELGVDVGVVVIGRNEGERLKRCLRSIGAREALVYVDSGSSDGSVAFARSLGIATVELANPPKFTAARARNAGFDCLIARWPDLGFVQMVDGDCIVEEGWVEAAARTLAERPDVAGVFGRRREVHPDRSLYNAFCDEEWNVSPGEAAAFGGDVLLRAGAVSEVRGYDETLIAGEDPDLSWRLREHGWTLLCLDRPMTAHDADMHRFSQWWSRATGMNWLRQCRSNLAWGLAVPGVFAALLLLGVWDRRFVWAALAILLFWLFKVVQIGRRKRSRFPNGRTPLLYGLFIMLGKFAELRGMAKYHRNRLRGRASHLIEYKAAA